MEWMDIIRIIQRGMVSWLTILSDLERSILPKAIDFWGEFVETQKQRVDNCNLGAN